MLRLTLVERGTPVVLEDKELIKRSKKGDIDAFEELVCRYERKVYTVAYRLINNHEDANDLAQETFIKAFKAINSFREEAAFSTWIYRITINVCKDELRKRQRQQTTSIDEEVWLEEGSIAQQVVDEHDTGPEERYIQKETREYLIKLIAQLSPDFRMAVILRDIQGLSYEEIAEALECSLGTVKSRINRARKALKDKILADRELSSVQFRQIK